MYWKLWFVLIRTQILRQVIYYLMGHSNASVTLDVYTHSSFESVERAFEQIAGNL